MEVWEWEGQALLQGPFAVVPSVPESMSAERDERKLVAEVQAGDREAFERLLDRYQGRVYGLVCRMVGTCDAEDVAQETLIQVCNSIASFRGRSSLATWIYRVAVNVCLEHRRKRRPEFVPFAEAMRERQPSTDDDPSAVAVKNEVRRDVDAAIRSLPEIHRDVVVLHELHGLTYRECAEALGCPVGTVKSRLSNAFVKLRELLTDYAPEGRLAK